LTEDNVRRIGRYEIIAGLSTGGMAELYLASTKGPGGFRKFVALKKLLGDVERDRNFARMFLDEARITALLCHANIAQVFDLGADENNELFIAMEFVAGQDLSKVSHACRKQGTRLPIGFAARVARDLCRALHYAHHFVDPTGRPSPVIHRDISPKNVMVTYEGSVKVIDFGLALARGRLETTAVGTIKGTAGYLSPEQVYGKTLDGRTDLYSAAVVLHELLCGQRLFTGQNRLDVMQRIVDGRVRPPRDLNPEVPRTLSDVVMKALSKQRSDRFATGREMSRAIELACGPLMYAEEQAAAFMQERFKDKVAQTRGLFAPVLT
jgi:serine/threonine protein kinase, bacterial